MSEERCPVFLIGAGRSGTKFLRSCLSVSSQVDSVPYDVNYVWRYGNENKRDDEFSPKDLTDPIKRYIIETLSSLTSTNKSQGKFLVEKSVPNTLKVSFINEIFPSAKFIHITRDGRAVIESSIRQWKQPPSKGYLLRKLKYFPWSNYRYAIWFVWNLLKSKLTEQPAIWGPRYKGINEDISELTLEDVSAKQWSKCVDIADEQLSLLESARVFKVSYEDLMDDSSIIADLCHFIGIDDIDIVEQYFQENVNRSNNEESIKNLSPEAIEAIDKYALDSLRRLGYK
jgi:hypothetical protein